MPKKPNAINIESTPEATKKLDAYLTEIYTELVNPCTTSKRREFLMGQLSAIKKALSYLGIYVSTANTRGWVHIKNYQD